MTSKNEFDSVFKYVLTSPGFVQFIFGFEERATMFLYPEHSDDMFDELKKRFDESKTYQAEWKRVNDGDGDYVKFIISLKGGRE